MDSLSIDSRKEQHYEGFTSISRYLAYVESTIQYGLCSGLSKLGGRRFDYWERPYPIPTYILPITHSKAKYRGTAYAIVAVSINRLVLRSINITLAGKLFRYLRTPTGKANNCETACHVSTKTVTL